MIVSYTGECYIRFIALRTDPIVNSRETYETLIEQTSRRITLQAAKQTADLNRAVAEIEIEFDHVRTTVTNNKDAADRAFANIISDLNAEIAAREDLEDVYYGTWVYQNDRLISLMAAQFNADGTIKGYADLKVQVDGISTTVTNNKSAADRAFSTLTTNLNKEIDDRQALENVYKATWVYQNDRLLSLMAAQFNADGTIKGYADLKIQVNGIASTVTSNKTAADRAIASLEYDLAALEEYAEDIDQEQTESATWISQNKNKWSAVAASFNNNGTINTYGRIALYVQNQLSTFEVDADQINFKTGTFGIKNRNNEDTFSVDADGNVFIKGNIYGGNLTGDLVIGTGNNKMYIRPNQTNGAELVGIKDNEYEALKLGFTAGEDGTYNAIAPQLTMSYYTKGTKNFTSTLKPYHLSIKNFMNNWETFIDASEVRTRSVYGEAFYVKTDSSTWKQGYSGSFTAGTKTVTVKYGIITGVS
jgi:hypothetical protein